jgi:hypothetical protein
LLLTSCVSLNDGVKERRDGEKKKVKMNGSVYGLTVGRVRVCDFIGDKGSRISLSKMATPTFLPPSPSSHDPMHRQQEGEDLVARGGMLLLFD